MQNSNERLTTAPGSDTDSVDQLTGIGQARGAIRNLRYSAFARIQPATAAPIAGPESS